METERDQCVGTEIIFRVWLLDGNIFIRSCAFSHFSRHIVRVYALDAIDKNQIFCIFVESVSPHANTAGLKGAFKLDVPSV